MLGRPRLPLERTTLAWTRTSVAFLVNGALLAIKLLRSPLAPSAVAPAILAVLLALCTSAIAVRRQRALLRIAGPSGITARRQVYVVGAAAMLLIVLIVPAQLN
ncbi:DUF202 domain-containing protein [Mycobacterium genavense]|uniref:DUF202 domain-containing protein n=1 Tax=Mycobacterium genavense TaxID=36812 RepID=UPI0004B631DB|nr:DUF202 domain-containing protein [Mycobacterium genavense]